MTIFIILLIYKFIKGTFEYEKVTRFELIIIPVYSAIMMVLSLENVRSLTAAGLTIILLILGASIGFLQASKTQIKDTNKLDSHQRPILKVKRNWPYLVGWLVSFAIGISVEVFYGAHINATVNTDLKLSEITGLKMYFFTGLNAVLYVVPCNLSCDMIYQKF